MQPLLWRAVGISWLMLALGCLGCHARSSIIQPNYQRWRQIIVGMTEGQVEALVGKPLRRTDPDWWKQEEQKFDPAICSYDAIYGQIKFAGPEFARVGYEFSVGYRCSDHTVSSINDPFEGRLSSDGKPLAPTLIYPVDGQKFSHYPRLLDFRWSPSSGVYPIEYELQFNTQPADFPWDGPTTRTKISRVPYLVQSWVGANVGVWRVRAKNKLGLSAWSEERKFSFNR